MRLKAINSQVFPDFRTVNKIYAEPSNQKEWGMYMTGDIFSATAKCTKTNRQKYEICLICSSIFYEKKSKT